VAPLTTGALGRDWNGIVTGGEMLHSYKQTKDRIVCSLCTLCSVKMWRNRPTFDDDNTAEFFPILIRFAFNQRRIFSIRLQHVSRLLLYRVDAGSVHYGFSLNILTTDDRSRRFYFSEQFLRELWFFVRIRPIRFLAGCRKRRLNPG